MLRIALRLPGSVLLPNKVRGSLVESTRSLLRDLLRRHTGDCDPGLGKRAIHHGVCSDGAVVTDLDRADDHRIRADKRIIADPGGGVRLAGSSPDGDAGMHPAVLTDTGSIVHDKRARVGDREPWPEDVRGDRETEA